MPSHDKFGKTLNCQLFFFIKTIIVYYLTLVWQEKISEMRGLSGTYPTILNTTRTGCSAIMLIGNHSDRILRRRFKQTLFRGSVRRHRVGFVLPVCCIHNDRTNTFSTFGAGCFGKPYITLIYQHGKHLICIWLSCDVQLFY